MIQALQDGRLAFAGDKVFIRDKAGAVLDAATGKPAASAPADLKNVRLNNRLRRSVEAALGGLTLLAADPAKRYEAAQAVFKSRDASALPTLDAALAKETDSRVKRALTEARAAVILFQADAKENDKLAAVAVIRERADQDSRGLLAGLPAGQPQLVQARRRRRHRVDRQSPRAVEQRAERLVRALARLGAAARRDRPRHHVRRDGRHQHGAWRDGDARRLHDLRGAGDHPLALSRPVRLCRCSSPCRSRSCSPGCVGIVIERCVIRFLYGRPLETLLATWGISLILQQAVRTAFGPTNKEVGNPSWMSGAFELGGITITYNRMWIIVFTLAVFVALLGLLRFTRLGLEMRAVTQNRQMAASMGIRTARIDALTFGLGSGIAGIAGVALSQIDNVSPNLGQGYIIDSFLVVVFGGVGNLWGTLVARLHARHRQQVPRAVRRRGARQDRDPGVHHPVHPEAPARAVRPQGPGGGGMSGA